MIMPFQPGHKVNEGRDYSGRASALQSRKRLRGLAIELRESVDFVQVRKNLESIALGRDPVTGEHVDARVQVLAMKELYDRAYGMAAQHVIVEGEIRNELIHVTPKLAHQGLTIEQINERRAQLRAMGVRPKVIDVQPAAQLEDNGSADEDPNDDE